MMSEKIINELVNMGANRWTKGGYERLYIAPEGLFVEGDRYNSGNVKDSEFNGERISNSLAREMLESKCYIDLSTNEIVCRNYTLRCALEELLESMN